MTWISSPRLIPVLLPAAFATCCQLPCVYSQTHVDMGERVEKRRARKISVDRELAKQHPLWPALELAATSYQHIRANIKDYSCIVVRRERVDGRLQQHEYMHVKVRHRRSRNGVDVIPFSLYLKFIAPREVEGREVLFVSGQNDGDMFVRKGGERFPFVTVQIKPESDVAMQDNRYPVTEFGFENLVRRLIDVAKEAIALNADVDVQFFNEAKVDGRSCTGVKVTHTTYDPRLPFHSASVFMDNATRVPLHFESFDWPREQDGAPVLLEQYTYRDIKLNVGFNDEDFLSSNPEYQLR